MATRLGDAYDTPNAGFGPGAASPHSPIHGARDAQKSHIDMNENPLRDMISGAGAHGGFEAARNNPLHGVSPASSPPPAAAGRNNARVARIAAAQSASKKNPVFTWKRAAIGAGVLALCAVVALTAGLASSSQSDANSANANAAGPSSAAGENAASGDSSRVSVGVSGGSSGSGTPTVPTARGDGSDAAGYATTTEVTALLSAYVDAPLAALRGEVQKLTKELEAANAKASKSESDVSQLSAQLEATEKELSAAKAALAAAEAKLDGHQTMLDGHDSDIAGVKAGLATTASSSTITQLQSDVSKAKSDISALQTSASTTATTLAAAQSDIGTVESDVAALRKRTTDVEQVASGQTASIAGLQADVNKAATSDSVTTVTSELASLEATVSALTSRVGTAESTVGSHTRDITQLQTSTSAIPAMQGDISKAQSDITSMQSDVAGAKQDATKASSDVSALSTRVGTAEGEIDTLQTDVAAAAPASAVTALQSDMTKAKSDITTLKSDVAGVSTGTDPAVITAMQGDISKAQSDITSMQSDVAGAKQDATKASSDVTALSTRVGTAEGDIDTLETTVSGLSGGTTSAAFTALSNKVDTVEGTANKAKSDIDSLTTRVGTVETDLTAAEADIATLKSGGGGGGGSGDLTALTNTVTSQGTRLKAVEDTLDDVEVDMNDMDSRVAKLRSDLNALGGGDDTPLPADSAAAIENLRFMLSRIGMVAIVSAEMAAARLRQTGNSGVIGARSYQGGSHPWHEGSFVNSARTFMSMHDHANFLDTVGLGEVSANMNGVEFWTRHNDYRMRTPDDKDGKYLALKALTYPDVPPEVAQCGSNINCGVTEMRKYFDAWSKQDTSIADYKPYFKPVLCYLEGWWTVSEADDKLEDASVSDRHSNAADTWEELYNRFRYLTFLGRKNSNENLPFLPSRIWEMKNGYEPVVAQWQFRITCQPLKNDVELSRFSVLPDLHVQLQSSSPMTRDQLADTRAARFALNQYVGNDQNRIDNAQYGPMSEDFLDSLMSQVSGLNNHGAAGAGVLTDSVPDGTSEEIAYPFDADQSQNPDPLDMTYYSRYYSVSKAGAMGQSVRRRGFSDATLWVAQTTQPKVASQRFMNGDGTYSAPVRASYALPLEIVYLTPLSNWNPYDIKIWDSWGTPEQGGRNGHKTNPARAYNGASRRTYFITPVEFFAGFGQSDAADTSAREVGVLDQNNNLRLCAASGHWIRFPYIQNVGQVVPYTGSRVRQRWPIAPVHIGTSVAWQELKALQAVVSTGDKTGVNAGLDIPVLNELRLVLTGGAGQTHEHVIRVDERRQDMLDRGKIPVWSTDTANGHKHKIAMKKDPNTGEYYLWSCDDIDDVDRAVSECNHDHGPIIGYN